MELKRVLVLFGGVSTEHLVSCRSAYNIIQGLREAHFEITRIGITKQGEWLRFLAKDEHITEANWEEIAREHLKKERIEYAPASSPREFILNVAGSEPDVIFPAVHGINSEDGTLQGLLALSGIPYVGSAVLGSAVCMDKAISKLLLQSLGIRQCRFTISNRCDILDRPDFELERIEAEIDYPMFLKPSNGGSSVGTVKAENREALASALRFVSEFDRTVIIEEYLNARELECAVLGNNNPVASRVGEIVVSDMVSYYDYETKYFSDTDSEARIPADIPEALEEEIRALSVQAFLALGVKGLARVDFFWDRKSEQLYLNEVNNLPGFTSISLYPKAFENGGMPLNELVKQLCILAVEEWQANLRREDV